MSDQCQSTTSGKHCWECPENGEPCCLCGHITTAKGNPTPQNGMEAASKIMGGEVTPPFMSYADWKMCKITPLDYANAQVFPINGKAITFTLPQDWKHKIAMKGEWYKELFYDMGLRGLTPKQSSAFAAWAARYNISLE